MIPREGAAAPEARAATRPAELYHVRPLGDLSGICDRALTARLDAIQTASRLLVENLDALEWLHAEASFIRSELNDRERREKQRETIRSEYARGVVTPYGAKAGD